MASSRYEKTTTFASICDIFCGSHVLLVKQWDPPFWMNTHMDTCPRDFKSWGHLWMLWGLSFQLMLLVPRTNDYSLPIYVKVQFHKGPTISILKCFHCHALKTIDPFHSYSTLMHVCWWKLCMALSIQVCKGCSVKAACERRGATADQWPVLPPLICLPWLLHRDGGTSGVHRQWPPWRDTQEGPGKIRCVYVCVMSVYTVHVCIYGCVYVSIH